MTPEQLAILIAAVEPVSLAAVRLLGTVYTVDDARKATVELLDYGERCADMANLMSNLAAVPVMDPRMVEAFAL
jgi:hypothetical protein